MTRTTLDAPKAPRRTAVLVALAAAVVVILARPGSAIGLIRDAVAPPPASPTSADQIQNLDQVKTAIKAYYGDTVDADSRRPDRRHATLHTFSPNGAYANEIGWHRRHGDEISCKPPTPTGSRPTAKPAIVLDVDDTTLNTYSYEIYSNFVYNPTQQCGVRQRWRLPRPCRTWSTSSSCASRQRLHGLLPDRPSRDPAHGDGART